MINFIIDGYEILEGSGTMALTHVIILFLVYYTKRISFDANNENLCVCVFVFSKICLQNASCLMI